MTYLYGDSSPANVQSNFLGFLGDALRMLVDVAQGSHSIEDLRQQGATLHRAAEEDSRELDALDIAVKRIIAEARPARADSAGARCASAIADRAAALVLAERDAVQSDLARGIERSEIEIAAQRSRTVTSLEKLLARHDLPETSLTYQLDANAHGASSARLHGRTPYGIATEIELEIPETHLLAQPLRLERIVERLEVHAPDMSGWISKSLKTKPHRLDRYHVTALVVKAGDLRLKLRAMPDGTGDGFDLHEAGSPASASITRIDEHGTPVGDPSTADTTEMQALRPVFDRLRESITELGSRRKRLVDARLDGEPIATLPEPGDLIDRLVEAMAPTVQEISRHSLAADELVLKRMLADGKREEYFVSKTDLRAILDAAPGTSRSRFAALGLDANPSATIPLNHTAPAVPAPSPSPQNTAPFLLQPAARPSVSPTAVAPRPSVVPAPLPEPIASSPTHGKTVVAGGFFPAEAAPARLEVATEGSDEITVEMSSASEEIAIDALSKGHETRPAETTANDSNQSSANRPSTAPTPMGPPRPRVPRIPPAKTRT